MDFKKHLIDIKHPATPNLGWDIEGDLKDRTNQSFKFDLKPIRRIKGVIGKEGDFKKRADKMVFEYANKYIIIDVEELIEYVKKKQLKIVHIKDLLEHLDWNIEIKK